jgi:hypothetical protein
MKTTDMKTIISEFADVKKNWKKVYQWKRIKSKGNTEIISELLLMEFDHIAWTFAGLRSDKFKQKDHAGNCQLKNGKIDPFTEKRFCRAFFNEYNETPHPLLGLILDYEIPLTAQKQKKGKIDQGEIDLISCRDKELLFIEAKVASSNESLLKAILEIFVYVMRLMEFKLLPQLLKEYEKPQKIKITSCILTFPEATSGKQLMQIDKYPNLIKLIEKINEIFKHNGINELEYYIVGNPAEDFDKVLKAKLIKGKNYKVTFNKEIQIIQHHLQST